MDLVALRAAYDSLVADARAHTFTETRDGGWSASQVLAHIVIGDRDFASLCAQLRWGRNPGYDNRSSQTAMHQDAVVRVAGSWSGLIETLRRGGETLLDVLSGLDDRQLAMPLLCTGVMGDRDVELTMLVGEFAQALATVHMPAHHQQLLSLAAVPA